MNISAPELLNLIKASFEFNGENVPISLDHLIELNHGVEPEEMINTLLELGGVTMHDKGFIIPKSYFK